MADEHYDAIVVGTSQGGRFLPLELAKAGHKVALVERDQLGGVCVNTGCTPTKTMVASARLAYQARRGAEYGVRVGPVAVDLAAVRERKRAMVAGARQNYASALAQDGLDLIEGEAHFTGPKTVEIALTGGGTRQISAPVVVIDAGTRPKPLAITGAVDVPVLDSTSIMELGELPEHLIILGGGYIGLEFGQMFRRFGSEVTIIQSAARLMMIEDEDVSDEVAAILRDDGITVLTSSTPVRVEPADGGRLRLTVRTEDGERQFEGSHLLSAIGRIPNTEGSPPRRPASVSTTTASSRSTSTWKPVSPASTRWGTSRAARPSPTFPTTITASCTPTSSGTRRRAGGTGSSRTRCSSTRSLAAPG
jgi:pyruvate/2-oxoglutarate dehydrogenase complex dihydrolipoamide dehydrogenase (E3) component